MSINSLQKQNDQETKTVSYVKTVVFDDEQVTWGIAEIVYFLFIVTMYRIIVFAAIYITNNPIILIPTDIILLNTCTIILIYCILPKKNNKLSSLTKSTVKIKYHIEIAIIIGIISGLLLTIVTIINNENDPNPIQLYEYILWILSITIYPFTEELWFRSFLYRGLRKYYGIIISTSISATLYTCLHIVNVNITLFILAIVITIYYERSNSLIGSIILHSISNSIIYIYHILYVYTHNI